MALDTNEEPEVAWEGDSLGYKEVGETFTTLVKSVKDDTKVISIEAGYGRGKTFFRKHWAAARGGRDLRCDDGQGAGCARGKQQGFERCDQRVWRRAVRGGR